MWLLTILSLAKFTLSFRAPDILNMKNATWWNRQKRRKWNARWAQVKSLRVIGRDCEFAIVDRCSRNAKGNRHAWKKAIVIRAGSDCLIPELRKDLGLSTKCLGKAYKLAT